LEIYSIAVQPDLAKLPPNIYFELLGPRWEAQRHRSLVWPATAPAHAR
jgi:hypothetical protein